MDRKAQMLGAARGGRWLALAVPVVAAVTVVAVAAGGSTAAKQRVAIDGKSTASGIGTFTFVPLTAGALKADSGKANASLNQGPTIVRSNGQSVNTLGGPESYEGANGTLNVSQRLVIVAAGRNHNVATGTWKVIGSTGVYAGYKGGGTFAAAQLPSGVWLFREEGYIAKG